MEVTVHDKNLIVDYHVHGFMTKILFPIIINSNKIGIVQRLSSFSQMADVSYKL